MGVDTGTWVGPRDGGIVGAARGAVGEAVATVHAGRGVARLQVRHLTRLPKHHLPCPNSQVALWLLYTLGEALPESILREKSGFFQQMMATLVTSRASAYPHRAVQPLFFEISVRYYRFYLANPEHLPGGLAVFLDARGIYNPNAAVRSRACYLLLRFIKQTIKAASSEQTRAGYVEVVRALLDLLAYQQTEASEYQRLLAELYASEGQAPPPAATPPHRANGPSPQPEPPQLSTAESLNLYATRPPLARVPVSPPPAAHLPLAPAVCPRRTRVALTA